MNHLKKQLLLAILLINSFAHSQPEQSVNRTTDLWVQQMFRDSLKEIRLPEFNDAYGVVFRDLSNNGLADIYIVRFRDLNRLFLNPGKNQFFVDYTIQSGLGGNLMSYGKENLELGASAVDFNNDGWQDILIVGWGLTTHLFHQKNNLFFRGKSPFAELYYPIDGNAGVWADIDLDGDLDLFITDEHYKNHLFINDGRGDFEDGSHMLSGNVKATSQGASFADVDQDGFPDLYVCNWFGPDIFYRNINGEKFIPLNLPITHIQDSLNSNGISFADVDNDGDLDFLVTDRNGGTRLYQNKIGSNDTTWVFRDITSVSGLENPYPAYGSVIKDFNNDGWQDIYITNIGPNRLYLNGTSHRFRLVYQEKISAGSTKQHYSTGVAAADFDNDGDLDLFIANKDTSSVLFRNPLNTNSYLRFQLEGVLSNRDAIGTKVWLFQDSSSQQSEKMVGYREISGGSGYLSIGETIAHFGVEETGRYHARILFPSGKEIFLDNLEGGQFHKIVETGGLRKSFIRLLNQFKRLVYGQDFWLNFFLFLLFISVLTGFMISATRRYHWQNRQTALFLISFMILGFILFFLLTGYKTWIIIASQITSLLIFISFITVFNEKIHRMELQRYGYRQLLQNFSQQLIYIKNNRELYEQMTSILRKSMKVDYCSALEISNNTAHFKTASGNWLYPHFNFEINAEIRKLLCENPLIKKSIIQDQLAGLKPVKACLIIPISGKDNLFAILLLGPRKDRKDFPAEDISLLQILAGQAVIAIENNLYIEESQKLIQKLTEAEIREKYVEELEANHQKLEQLYRELQETQTQLIQSEKLAGLGQLVAGFAHELNNPISFVYANMKELKQYTLAITELLELLNKGKNEPDFYDTLQEKFKSIDQKYNYEFIKKDINNLIGESLEGSDRVKNLVQNLRNFSRLDEAEFKPADLHQGLESTLMLLNNEMKNRIEIHKDFGQLPKVFCNPGHLNQVFMNLLLNAVQAINGKGDIWITTRKVENCVHIKICDSGKGIPGNIKNKIFDPFFTTKAVGKGTGLGLSICYNIIQEHGGNILLESESGKGTTFEIVIPINKTNNSSPRKITE